MTLRELLKVITGALLAAPFLQILRLLPVLQRLLPGQENRIQHRR